MTGYSEAQRKSANKYRRGKLDTIQICTEKGKRDIIKKHAAARGESMNYFINRAIDEAIERDKAADS